MFQKQIQTAAWLGLCVVAPPLAAEDLSSTMQQFITKRCAECHDAETKKGNFDITALNPDFTKPETFAHWVKVHDRVRAGEMPPAKKEQPPAAEREAMLKGLNAVLTRSDTNRQRDQGRVPLRRLNRSEYENTMRDLFSMPGLAVKELLPEDGRFDGFDKASDALELSAVQIRKYLEAADYVLDRAIVHQDRPMVYKKRIRRVGPLNQMGDSLMPINDMKVDLVRMKAIASMRLPEKALVFEPMDSLGIITGAQQSFHGEVGDFSAAHPGYYRVRASVWSFDYQPGEIFPAQRMQSFALLANDRLLARFDAPSLKAREHEVVVWLNAAERLSLNPDSLWPNQFNPRGYTGPCVAVDWVDLEGPLNETWPPASHRRLFGDSPIAKLPIEKRKTKQELAEANTPSRPVLRVPAPPARHSGAAPNYHDFDEFKKSQPVWTAASPLPKEDAGFLLADFLLRAFRRPVASEELAEYVKIAHERLAAGDYFESAMRAAYRVALCSPDFLFLNEPPASADPKDSTVLDQYALAARLSYFLWNSMPDDELTGLAAKRNLSGKEIDAQVERMLSDPRSDRFVADFLDQWLDLRKIDATSPDVGLYPEFHTDLRSAMLDESRAFFREMLDKDLGAAQVIDSDFVMINQRLAEHYGIPGVTGSTIRRVAVPTGCPRGGFLTQAAVLKVTANGTTTSPVMRGVWVVDRVLGRRPQPPPPDIAAVDPDVRGTTTIREQLDKHRSNQTCAACHAKFDPPGFALENFDVIGTWRTRYRHSGDTGDFPAHADFLGAPMKMTFESFRYGLPVDATGTTSDGQVFKDIREFKRILLTEEETVARNLVSRLVLYATGAPVSFADRAQVERILAASRGSQFGLRTIIHQLARSPLLLRK